MIFISTDVYNWQTTHHYSTVSFKNYPAWSNVRYVLSFFFSFSFFTFFFLLQRFFDSMQSKHTIKGKKIN